MIKGSRYVLFLGVVLTAVAVSTAGFCDVTISVGDGEGLPCLTRSAICTGCDQAGCGQLGISCTVGEADCYLYDETQLCTNCNESFCFELNNPCVQEAVPVSLDNPDIAVKGVQVDICDTDNYLVISRCRTTARSQGFACARNELANGCARIFLYYYGTEIPPLVIEPGSGPIFTVEYTVQPSAPQGECREFALEGVKIADSLGNPIPDDQIIIDPVPGNFCFVSPSTCGGVTPNTGMQGNSYTVTITGQNTNFVQGTTEVSFENTGITVNSVTVQGPTQLQASISIAPGAPTGTGDVTVTTASEIITCSDGFSVQATTLGCLSVVPSSGTQGNQNLLVTITGQNTNFVQGTTQVSFSGTGITVVSGTTQVSSPTVVSARINIGGTAAIGLRTVTVTTGTEVIQCTNSFQVLAQQIGCVGVTPSSGMQDSQNVQVVITGQNSHFVQGSTVVSFANPGITVSGTTVNSATQVTVLIAIDEGAPAGAGDVTVTTGSEVIVCYDLFTVLEKIFEISEVRASNPTSSSFTVSWVTNGNANGLVHYSPNPGLSGFMTAYDERGAGHLDDTHHVSIGDLEPETTYYYEIISGGTVDNNSGLYYSFTTMQIPDAPPSSCPAYGWVYLEDGILPAEGAIVYLKVTHGAEESYWISTLADASGIWLLNLGNLFSTVTGDALPYAAGDLLRLEFQGGGGRVNSAELTVPARCPLFCGTVVLEHFIAAVMDFNTGFNLIAFPFIYLTDENYNQVVYTACDLIAAVPGSTEALSWDSNAQRWLTALDAGGGNCIGDDFLVEPGKGYFVKCSAEASSTFYGKELSYPLALTFEPGLNLVAVSYPPDYYSACSLMGAIAGSDTAFSWDATFQKWLTSLLIGEGLCIGDNFTIERDRGYFIHSTIHIDRWVPGVGCSTDGDCNDNNACTDDACVDNVCQYSNNSSACDDGLYCTENDVCSGGACVAGTVRDCSAAGDQCNAGVCDEGLNQCVAQPVANGTGCDDGLYCTQVDQCLAGACLGSDDPCVDNGAYCDGVEYCTEDVGGYLCNSTGDPCVAPLTCDEVNDACTGSEVTLSIGDAYGYAGTIDVELDNPVDAVSEVHLNVCDVDLRPWFVIDTAGCATTGRSADFSCVITGLGGGCVQVDLTTAVAGLISQGTGAIAQLNYSIAAGAPETDVADVEPRDYSVLDDGVPPLSLTVTPVPGRVGAVE